MVNAPPKGFRPHMPMRVKAEAALIRLGLEPHDVEFDHDPPIHMRIWNAAKGDTDPPANDPRHIVPRSKSEHRRKTHGRKGTSVLSSSGDGDQSRIAKLRRTEASEEEFRRRLLTKEPGQPRPKSKRWPKRPMGRGRD